MASRLLGGPRSLTFELSLSPPSSPPPPLPDPVPPHRRAAGLVHGCLHMFSCSTWLETVAQARAGHK